MKSNLYKKSGRLFSWAAIVIFAASFIFTGCPGTTSVPGTAKTPGKPSATTQNKYNITFSVEGGHGTFTAAIDGESVPSLKTKPIQIEYGKTLVFTAEADTGYEVDKWTGAAPDEHNKNRATLTVSADVTVTVSFKRKVYPVSFEYKGGNGTLTATMDGTVFNGGKVAHGKEVRFMAEAADGYTVQKWTLNGAVVNGTVDTYLLKITDVSTVQVFFERAPVMPQSLSDKTYTVDGTEFTMKGIAAVRNGTLGSIDGDIAENDNKAHTVNLSTYRIGETEVTQELWDKVMDSNMSGFTSPANPVENVSWYDCIAFCNELTQKVDGLGSGECVYYSDPDFNTVYTAQDGSNERLPYQNMNKKGFRLPTEAEWEWAAQGGKRAKWAGTNEKARLKDYAWYVDGNGGDAGGTTHAVKQKLPNGYGLYDMSGNVYEWCWNWSDSKTPADGETDPVGSVADQIQSADPLKRVIRGGSWNAPDTAAACAYRGSYEPAYNIFDNDVGFRLVCR